MSKYLVSGTLMVPFPFELKVEADSAVEAESKAVKGQRILLRNIHNLETNERPANVVVREINDEEDR